MPEAAVAPRGAFRRKLGAGRAARRVGGTWPVLMVVAVLIGAWYLACLPMNATEALFQAERAGAAVTPEGPAARRDMSRIALARSNPQHLGGVWSLDRPRLPAPHQVTGEMWRTGVMVELEGSRGLLSTGTPSPRGLIHHAGVTLGATLLGFAIGAALGIALAVGIVHDKAMEASVLPWAIVSQTVPIIALAPMVIVVLNSVGVQGIWPKAVISTYLSFFPVVVGMVTGFRSPRAMDLDLMRTWGASRPQTFRFLRVPSSVPYLFASLKIAIAAALVGAIVAELPTGAQAGLGARMLAGSYYGQTEQIWAALFAAALVAAGLVGLVGLAERTALKRMGMTQ